MAATVLTTWPIVSEDEDGLSLGQPMLHGPAEPVFEVGDVVYNGIMVRLVRDYEYQRLNFGKLG